MKNIKGFSLISTLISIAIMGILSIAFSNMLILSTKSNTTNQVMSDITNHISGLQNLFNNPNNLTQMLSGNDIKKSIIINDPIIDNQILSQTGMKFKSWSILNIYISSAIESQTTPTLYKLSLSINVSKDKNATIGLNVINRQISTVYCFIIDNKITTCNNGVMTTTTSTTMPITTTTLYIPVTTTTPHTNTTTTTSHDCDDDDSNHLSNHDWR